jgi:hypothetical protein
MSSPAKRVEAYIAESRQVNAAGETTGRRREQEGGT